MFCRMSCGGQLVVRQSCVQRVNMELFGSVIFFYDIPVMFCEMAQVVCKARQLVDILNFAYDLLHYGMFSAHMEFCNVLSGGASKILVTL